MVEKQVKLLKYQIDKLDQKEFDLEAWKSSSIAILSKLFGANDPKVKQIEGLKIDYGSWALRDASSRYDPVKTCKNVGREVLEASITELEAFGIPGQLALLKVEGVISLLEDNLKVTQLKAVKEIILSDQKEEEKKQNLAKKLESFGKEVSSQVLGALLATTELREGFE